MKAVSFWIEKAKPAIKAALPNIGFTAERFARVAMTLVTSNPMLQECDPKTIAVGVIRSAQLGLSLDPLLGESYLIPRWNGKHQRMEASWQRGYRGVVKLIRRTGELSGIAADVVHRNDKFMRAANGDVFHEKAEGDRGPRTKAYVALYFKDGFVSATDMTIQEIYAIRDRYSEGYKAFAAGKIKDNPWDPNNPITEKWMLIKTVIFQAAHLAPMETESGQQLVKEAVADQLPPDETMDALASELFEGDESIDLTRTEDRLSKSDAMAKQLAGDQPTDDQPVTDAQPAGEVPNNAQPREVSPEREQLEAKLVTARDHVFAKLLDGDRFVAAKTDAKFASIEDLVTKGSDEDVQQMIRDINKFADQRAQV